MSAEDDPNSTEMHSIGSLSPKRTLRKEALEHAGKFVKVMQL
jgi:hypothetical protein